MSNVFKKKLSNVSLSKLGLTDLCKNNRLEIETATGGIDMLEGTASLF